MGEVIVMPDAEAVMVEYLAAELVARSDLATVHTQTPSPRPGRFVTVIRVGGPQRSRFVDQPTLAFEAWEATAAQAERLCALVRALVHAAAGTVVDGVSVYRVDEAAGPANLPDPLSDQARYTFTASVAVRGAAA